MSTSSSWVSGAHLYYFLLESRLKHIHPPRDTVCSVGLIPRRLPFVSSNTAIRYFRHAVSLDERRAKFKANIYNRPTKEEAELGVKPGEMPTPTKDGSATPVIPHNTVTGMWETVRRSVKWDEADNTITDSTLKMFSEIVESMQVASHSRSQSSSSSPSTKGKGTGSRPKPKKRKSVQSDTDEDDAKHEPDFMNDSYDDRDVETPHETDVMEVWFAGCHCGALSLFFTTLLAPSR